MVNMNIIWPLAFHIASSLAQTTIVTSYVPAETTPTTYEGVTHTIAAGKGGHTFIPDVTLANVGDTIEFDFYPLNHSVVRAEYQIPCVPYEMTGPKVGFFSGFMPVDAILANPPKWTVVVNDTDPIFYYCSAPGSCLDYGMVGVINPNASVSLEIQRELALNSTFMLQPGEPWPPEASSTVLPTTTATVVSTAVSTPTSDPAETTSAAPVSSHHSSLSGGAIAGIAIGGAAVLLAAGFLVWWCGRRSRGNNAQPDAPPKYVPPQYTTYPPLSPSAKHASGITTSSGYPGYSYADHPNMGPFGAVPMTSPQHQQQPFYAPQPSPGVNQTSPLMGATGHPNVAEVNSMRGGSPSPPPNGGIAAFLERSGRMSPSSEGQNDTNRK